MAQDPYIDKRRLINPRVNRPDAVNYTNNTTITVEAGTTYTANGRDLTLLCNTDGPGTTVVLPNGVDGLDMIIRDVSGNAQANPITIQVSGTDNINSSDGSIVTSDTIAADGDLRYYRFANGSWVHLASGGSGGGGGVTSVSTGDGLTGGPITTTGTIEFDPAFINVDSGLGTRELRDSNGTATVNWQGDQLIAPDGSLAINWAQRTLNRPDNSAALNWASTEIQALKNLNFDTGTTATVQTVDNSAGTESLSILTGSGVGGGGLTGDLSALTGPTDGGSSGQFIAGSGNVTNGGSSGGALLKSGDATGVGSTSANVNVRSGSADTGTGNVSIESGDSATASSGNIEATTGQSDLDSGWVELRTGPSNNGASGNIVLAPSASFATQQGSIQLEGPIVATKSEQHAIQMISDVDSPFAPGLRNYRTIIVDNSAGAVVIDLPDTVGLNGYEAIIIGVADASLNTIVINAGGSDVFESGAATLTLNGAVLNKVHMQYLNGVWYAISFTSV